MAFEEYKFELYPQKGKAHNRIEKAPVEKMNDVLEKHIAMVWGSRRDKNPETGEYERSMRKYERTSHYSNAIRHDIKFVLQEIIERYEGDSPEADIAIAMIREDIAQL